MNIVKHYSALGLCLCLVAVYLPIMTAVGDYPNCKCGCQMPRRRIKDELKNIDTFGIRKWILNNIQFYKDRDRLDELSAFFTNHCNEHKEICLLYTSRCV